MNRGALRENFRALTVAAEPETEAEQQKVRVRAVGLPPSKENRASTRDGLVKLRDFVISRA